MKRNKNAVVLESNDILHSFRNRRLRVKLAIQPGVLPNAISRVTLCERREGSFVGTVENGRGKCPVCPGATVRKRMVTLFQRVIHWLALT